MLNRKKISKLSDEELLKKYKESSLPQFFGELYNRYIPLLYGVGLNYLQDANKAQDAVVQLYETLLQKINNYEIATFKTWIYSAMKNQCSQIGKSKKSENLINDFEIDFVESDEILNLLNEVDKNDERIPILKKCIKKLPVEQRVTILRFFYEDMSYLDIAESTHYGLEKVKNHIQKGKNNLKILIEKS